MYADEGTNTCVANPQLRRIESLIRSLRLKPPRPAPVGLSVRPVIRSLLEHIRTHEGPAQQLCQTSGNFVVDLSVLRSRRSLLRFRVKEDERSLNWRPVLSHKRSAPAHHKSENVSTNTSLARRNCSVDSRTSHHFPESTADLAHPITLPRLAPIKSASCERLRRPFDRTRRISGPFLASQTEKLVLRARPACGAKSSLGEYAGSQVTSLVLSRARRADRDGEEEKIFQQKRTIIIGKLIRSIKEKRGSEQTASESKSRIEGLRCGIAKVVTERKGSHAAGLVHKDVANAREQNGPKRRASAAGSELSPWAGEDHPTITEELLLLQQ